MNIVRITFLTSLIILTVLCTGCMSLLNGAGSVVGAAANTTVTAAKAGGIMLKDAATGTMNLASNAWKQASVGGAPEPQEPSQEP